MKGVERYTELFVNRKDAHALQRRDSTYILRKKDVTKGVVEAHLLGKIKWACTDADSQDGLKILQQVSRRLSQLEIPSHIEESRQGAPVDIHLADCSQAGRKAPSTRCWRKVVKINNPRS